MAEPQIAQKGPYAVDVKEGKAYFCGCKHSGIALLCDGSHSKL